MLLQNRTALITAGDCRVGRRLASVFALHGASVMLCGANRTQGNATVHQLELAGGKAKFCLVDVSAPDDVEAVIHETVATFGRVDILCNNASFDRLGDAALVLDLTTASWERIVELSLHGAFLFSQYALPFLRRSPTGSIINIVPYPYKGMHLLEGTNRRWMI
ncbi:MAG: SDR family NAD(P)-dependent oxidoreductase, partial [Cyanobacteria bacterium P01_D01_bin.2]